MKVVDFWDNLCYIDGISLLYYVFEEIRFMVPSGILNLFCAKTEINEGREGSGTKVQPIIKKIESDL